MRDGNGRSARLVTPPNIPTFDVDEVVHIEMMGDRMKMYYAAPVPMVSAGGILRPYPQIKVALIWPIRSVPITRRKVDAVLNVGKLLEQEDMVGEPKGHG